MGEGETTEETEAQGGPQPEDAAEDAGARTVMIEGEDGEPVEAKSHIVLGFREPGHTEFAADFKNVTPSQLLAAGAWLSERARWLLQKDWAQAEMEARQEAVKEHQRKAELEAIEKELRRTH